MTIKKDGIEKGLYRQATEVGDWRRAEREKLQRGASMVELSVILPLLMLLLVGVVDMGRAFYLSIEVADAARAGAQYGYATYATSKDTAGISTAAKADAIAAEVPGMSVVSAYGCMCSDGSSGNTNCTTPPLCVSPSHLVNYVKVDTSATYTTLFPWPNVPASIPISGHAQLVAGQ